MLQLWLTLSLNSCSGGTEESGSDIFMFNASRVPTIPLNQGQRSPYVSQSTPFSAQLSNHSLLVFSYWYVYMCLYVKLLSLVFQCSLYQQFPVGASLVPQHLPEDLVSGASLPYPHDQHALQW
jgi:hypothetical protein